MVNQEVLFDYSEAIKRLKKQSQDEGITDEEFRRLYFEALKSLDKIKHSENNNRRRTVLKLLILFISIITLAYASYNFKSVYSCIICNLQDYIYPGLKFLRRLSIPVISLFPSLTEWYHETCLVQNPFFTVVDMDCWPCSSVNNIREIYDPKPVNEQHTPPFIYETDQQVLHLESLKDLFGRNKDLFEKDSPKILTNNKYHVTPQEMFVQHSNGEKNYHIWKFNTMNMAWVLRQLIPRPKVVPKFGQSTERFIIVDSSQNSFNVPDTECSFSFLLALSGSRTINLVPAQECKHQCKSLKVELKESYLLWYNWWYWRPVVQPGHSNVTLIAHVGSYCTY